MYKVIIGIDPGKSGGICAYSDNVAIKVMKCPSDARDMASSINTIVNNCEIDGTPVSSILAVIENVHAFPTDSRSSSFKFGTNFGMWLGICASYKIKLVKIQPVVWMRSYGEYPKEKAERKRYFKTLASSYCPDIKVTLKTADAILIAKYYFNEQQNIEDGDK